MTDKAKTIVLTGGGTAGHVMPNIALLPHLRSQGFSIHYIGTSDGIERQIISKEKDVTYHAISAGKLRRYMSLKNITDPFRVLAGFFQARRLLKCIKPDVVFSKGGFVAVPVVVSAKLSKIPAVIHESDLTPGLANKLCIPSAARVCVTFPQTLQHLPAEKAVITGTPIRQSLYSGNADTVRRKYGITHPLLLIMGGSLGARSVNECVREALPRLLERYDIIHICGKGNTDPSYEQSGYIQLEFADAELADIFAASDIVLTRAGANSLFEFLALNKPMLLIPLPRSASRGDQYLNAMYLKEQGLAAVLEQEQMTPLSLVAALEDLHDMSPLYKQKIKEYGAANGTQKVMDVILSVIK